MPTPVCSRGGTVVIPLHRRRDSEGAAAVEFALVAPILFLVLFGILQYGLYFFDAHGTRTGVREAARLGVVKTISACGGATDDLAKLNCTTEDLIDAITGPVAVKVHAPGGWDKAKPLVVCAMVQSDGAIGLLPMPNDGLITSKTQMSIEVATPAPTALVAEDSPLAGADWSWC
jgi:Flp pilus assembly protein TadG